MHSRHLIVSSIQPLSDVLVALQRSAYTAVVRITEVKSPLQKMASPANAGTPRNLTTTATTPARKTTEQHINQAQAGFNHFFWNYNFFWNLNIVFFYGLFMFSLVFQRSILRGITAETQMETPNPGASPPAHLNDGISAPYPAAVSPPIAFTSVPLHQCDTVNPPRIPSWTKKQV